MAKRQVAATSYSGGVGFFEAKLKRVMTRLGIETFDWNHDRYSAFVEFRYKGAVYRFHQSLENAAQRGVRLNRSSDCFAQLVLSLEDLARMVERGIYELSTWVAGMKALPAASTIPECFRALQFTEVPAGPDAVEMRYRKLAKVLHPDTGGNEEEFKALGEARAQAVGYFFEGEGKPDA